MVSDKLYLLYHNLCKWSKSSKIKVCSRTLQQPSPFKWELNLQLCPFTKLLRLPHHTWFKLDIPWYYLLVLWCPIRSYSPYLCKWQWRIPCNQSLMDFRWCSQQPHNHSNKCITCRNNNNNQAHSNMLSKHQYSCLWPQLLCRHPKSNRRHQSWVLHPYRSFHSMAW